MTQEMRAPADPAPLGWAALALTTFVFSAHTAGWAPDIIWIGLAVSCGGLGLFAAGAWSFLRGNTFMATMFSAYGLFWLSLGSFAVLDLFGKVSRADAANDLGWFLLAFAVFNTYMLVWSARTNAAIFGTFLALEVTEILLFLGYLSGTDILVKAGAYLGIITAFAAWYTSAAEIANGMAGRAVWPVGRVIWKERGRRRAAA
jgi:succinate-acetate transporter protein